MRLFFSLALFLLFTPADICSQPSDYPARGREIVSLIRTHFYDAEVAEKWAETHAGYTDGVVSADTFAALTRRALARLKTSHTAYYTLDDPDYYGLRAIFQRPLGLEDVRAEDIGAAFTTDHFVRIVLAGSPAAEAGLLRGDLVLRADGVSFHPVHAFQGRAGQPVVLTIQRQADTPPIHLTVTPRLIDPRQAWLEAQQAGSRVVAHGGLSVAYAPLYSCAGDEYKTALQDAILGDFREADALVIDFRDGWGGCNPDFLDLFNPLRPVLTQTGRDGQPFRYEAQWRKPLYLLINGGTRSGKEIVAFAVRKHGLGTLIGQPTAGAVTGGRCFLLSDDTLLYVGVAAVTVDGERLEGIGVAPNMTVPALLPFAAGADPQLEAALDLAAQTR